MGLLNVVVMPALFFQTGGYLSEQFLCLFGVILLSDNDLFLAEIEINTTLRKPIVTHFLKKIVQIVPLSNLRAGRAPNFVQSLVPAGNFPATSMILTFFSVFQRNK